MREQHTHELPKPDPAFCSCCRKAIIQGLHNTFMIQGGTTGVRALERDSQGVVGEKRPIAYFHGSCGNYHSVKSIECEKCGTFSKAKKVRIQETGEEVDIKSVCGCSCHEGKDFCSLLIL